MQIGGETAMLDRTQVVAEHPHKTLALRLLQKQRVLAALLQYGLGLNITELCW